jgi:UDP-N-acetylmuramoyl-L-alanyl-D-glutamate--2,6-diaminopimelate ligase
MAHSFIDPAGVSLREVLPHAQWHGGTDARVASVSADSQACQPGDAFVALAGRKYDGHDFAQDAVKRGAKVVIAERQLEGLSVPLCQVRSTGDAYGRLCQALVGNPSQRVKTIGITGTNGKTTVTYLIASLLEHAGFRPGVLGTLGYCDRREMHPASHTTPPAHTLATWLGRMRANGCTHAVMEVSSHSLTQARVAGVEFDTVCVTNVRHDHLDYHGSLTGYKEAKRKIFKHLKPEGVAVLNSDDPGSISLLGDAHGPVLTVGMNETAEVSATIVEQRINEQTFLLTVGDDTVTVRSHLIGTHNIMNSLVAVAVGLGYGIDLQTMARGLEDVRVMPGRLERLECGQPFGVFVDYAHTPDALSNCLDTLRPLTEGRLICVFGAGGDRDKLKRPLMGRVVDSKSDVAIVTSDNPRSEPPGVIANEILSGFRPHRKAKVILDRAEAIEWALSQAKPGDCVLIAGKGHENYQIIGNRRLAFDDREMVRGALWSQPAKKKTPMAA